MDILSKLGKGKYMATPRNTLCLLCDLSDRKLRHEIEMLQTHGHPIVNMSDGCGYYLAKDEAELEAYLKQEWHRVGKQMRKLNAMKKAKYLGGKDGNYNTRK